MGEKVSLFCEHMSHSCKHLVSDTYSGLESYRVGLEEEVATHPSILAWRSPWTEQPGGLQSTGLQESDTTERLSNARGQ